MTIVGCDFHPGWQQVAYLIPRGGIGHTLPQEVPEPLCPSCEGVPQNVP